jgi:hypothetical protein
VCGQPIRRQHRENDAHRQRGKQISRRAGQKLPQEKLENPVAWPESRPDALSGKRRESVQKSARFLFLWRFGNGNTLFLWLFMTAVVPWARAMGARSPKNGAPCRLREIVDGRFDD